MKRILVTGSRDWEDRSAIADALTGALSAFVREGTPAYHVTLVHGACPTGADAMADEIWLEMGISEPERHPADWSRYGRPAGPKRNKEMVDLGADICLAFIGPGSRGAKGCAKLAEDAGIETKRITP